MVAPFPPPVTKLFLRVPFSHLQKVACQIAEWTLSLCSTEFDCYCTSLTAQIFFLQRQSTNVDIFVLCTVYDISPVFSFV